MASNFLNQLNSIFQRATGDNSTDPEPCETKINHYKFYQFALIPAMAITLAFGATKKRKNIFLSIFSGRPGLIFPMDSLTRTSRLSYACAFGATAILVYQIVLEQTFAIEFDGNRALKSFIAIASMFIYGMVFFPVFSSLAIGSVFGYALGSLYVWMLTGVEIYKLTECTTTAKGRLLLVFRGLPSLLCLFYLSISIPLRMGLAFKKKKYFYWHDDFEETNTIHDILQSYSGHHVRKLFLKTDIKPPPEGGKAKLISCAKGLFHRFVYQRTQGFRYSSRIISVMLISVLVIYTLTFELMSTFPRLFDMLGEFMIQVIDAYVGLEEEPGEESEVTIFRELLYVAWYLIFVTKVCIIVSTTLATLFALLNILHSLSSYRANLYALYKGDHSHIPPASISSNTNHCIDSIKYAGFQVGYIIWSYLIQLIIMTLIAFIIAVIWILVTNGFSNWIIWVLELLWPVVLTALIVLGIQNLLAMCLFLQDRGAVLALNNRSFYFNFTYFMFFYNIFLGLVSCLLRILKAMIVGIVFLSRLDNSTLPRRFEFIDPGFQAYVGYLQVEAAHTHPVVIVFTRLMLLALYTKREREAAQGTVKSLNGAFNRDSNSSTLQIMMNGDGAAPVELTDLDLIKDDDERRKRLAARFNWHVCYTLLHNPDIRVLRKGYMQMLRQARLMGVSVPVSDRQADVNFEELQQNIAQARERLNPSKAKKDKKEKEEEVSEDNVDDSDDVKILSSNDGGDPATAEAHAPNHLHVAFENPNFTQL